MPVSIDVHHAQQLCDRVGRALDITLSVMGAGGEILASSARERIGDTHAVAGRIMAGEIAEQAVTAEMAAASPGMREGYNRALMFNGERVASLGIAAPVDFARRMMEVASFCVESDLRARYASHDIAIRLKQMVGASVEGVLGESQSLTGAVSAIGDTQSAMNRDALTARKGAEGAAAQVTEIAALGEALNDAFAELANRLSESGADTAVAADGSEETSEAMAQLNTAASEIGGVSETIASIAMQTNLLALNANVEAARAGPAGRSFAVVAQEVQALAEKTANATKEIKQRIADLQSQTTAARDAQEGVRAAIEKVQSVAEGAGEALQAHRVAVEDIRDAAKRAVAQADGARAAAEGVEIRVGEVGGLLSGISESAGRLLSSSGALNRDVGRVIGELSVSRS